MNIFLNKNTEACCRFYNCIDDKFICLQEDLSIGHLFPINSNERYNELLRFGYPVCTELMNENNRFFEELSVCSDVVVWYELSSMEFCGLCFICHILKDKTDFLDAIEYIRDEKEVIKVIQRKKIDIYEYAIMWEKAIKDNCTLRTVISDKLVSVEEDYYDQYILNAMQKLHQNDLMCMYIILQIYKETGLYLSDHFISYRYKCICHSK